MSLRDVWRYDGSDPMLHLFTHAVTRWGLNIAPGDRVLELGCCETDWARLLKAIVKCEVVGVDARPCPGYGGDRVIEGDAADPALLRGEAGTFDVVISLGAIEHFGLGWYGDPVGECKDKQAVANAWRWLKPGGLIYFDVPWTPGEAHQTAHYRVYSDETWLARLASRFVWRARGWAPNAREQDGFTEIRPLHAHDPFYFYAAYGVKPL